MALFKTPYKRPKRFSNPYDHCPDETLSEVLDRNDLDMTWYDYRIIFDLTPIASYQEACYFLPFALGYIEMNADSDALQCITEIVHFISDNAALLKQNGLLLKCEDSLKSCLNTWTSTFLIEHYDKEACGRKGWTLDHDDIVANNQLLTEGLDDMVRYKTIADIAFDFVGALRSSEQALQCAWYLELCSTNQLYGFIRDEKLKQLLTDQQYVERCFDIVRKTDFVNQTTSPTYWSDICERLGVTR